MDILDLIFPKTCLDCGRSGSFVCPSCVQKVSPPGNICPNCLTYSTSGKSHAVCLKEFNLDGLASVWRYKGVVRRAILALKYRFALEIARELSFWASEDLKKRKFLFPKEPTLVPIPLYWYKRNFRGFNQVEEMGRLIAEKLNWQFIPDFLIKTVPTVPQVELGRHERLANTKDSFSLNPRYKHEGDSRHNVLLFDDVWTTGSTLKQACEVLKKNGVKKVWGLILTR